eukprot:1160375-Pelagomonas_calceolata.AAC.2
MIVESGCKFESLCFGQVRASRSEIVRIWCQSKISLQWAHSKPVHSKMALTANGCRACMKRKEKSAPAKRPRALRKSSLTSKLARVSPKGPPT